MVAANRRKDHAQRSFHVGDRVKFLFGTGSVEGVIVEDRGPIGVGGRRLFRVEFALDVNEPTYIELPAAEMEPAG